MATAVSDIDLSFSYPLPLENLKIGIVYTRWNADIIQSLRSGAVDALQIAGLQQKAIIEKEVPGAFELALGAQWLLNDLCDAVICLGAVIQGDTPHFEYVSQAATTSIAQVGLQTNKPCIFGVLTVLNHQQAMERAGGKLGNKGAEAALTALHMLALQYQIEKKS